MLNQVVVMGNLTRDPEMRYSGDTAICKFGIALNEVWGGRDNRQEKTHFFDVVAFGRTAENLNEFFRKGDQIVVIGSLQYDSWEDRDSGNKRSKVEIKCFSFEFTRGGTDRNDGDSGRRGGRDRDDRRDDRRDSRQDDRGRGRGRDEHRQERDDRNDGRDEPRGGGGTQHGIDFDDIPF